MVSTDLEYRFRLPWWGNGAIWGARLVLPVMWLIGGGEMQGRFTRWLAGLLVQRGRLVGPSGRRID